MAEFLDPRWLQELIASEAGIAEGIAWLEPEERGQFRAMRPSETPPGNRRLTDAQREVMDEGLEDLITVGIGPPIYVLEKHNFRMLLLGRASRPDTLWGAIMGQPTFLMFPAGRDEKSLLTAVRPYLPTDLARPRAPRSTAQLQADVAEALKKPIPGPFPGQTRAVRLMVGFGLAHINNELPLDFDNSLLKTGVVDIRYLMQGSIAPDPNPAVTVVRTIYSRSTVRLDWYEKLGGVVCAEIYYAPATHHQTIEALNERFNLGYPLDIPIDVPALLLGLEAIPKSALLEHVTHRVSDPNLLADYLDCLTILAQPDVADVLRPFMNHPQPLVRQKVIHIAAARVPALLNQMQTTETYPDLRAQIAGAIGAAALEPPRVPPPAAKKTPETIDPVLLRGTLDITLKRKLTEPVSTAIVLLNANVRSDQDTLIGDIIAALVSTQAALIADIAATFPPAPAVRVTRPPWGGPGYHFDKTMITTIVLPVPLPESDREACYGASWLWPTAKADLRNHTAMIVLSTRDGKEPADRLGPLTMLAAALIGTDRSVVGVCWDGHLIPAKVFREIASRDLVELPLALWIKCPTWMNPNGLVGGYTVGLAQFGHPEIETTDAPLSVSGLRQRLHKLAGKLITQSPQIRDGAVIGRSSTETVTARYGASQFGLGGPGDAAPPPEDRADGVM
jgi:hypothetical protein